MGALTEYATRTYSRESVSANGGELRVGDGSEEGQRGRDDLLTVACVRERAWVLTIQWD
jgi:hypothetical protein